MQQTGREMRPMLNGSWKRPPANGRHGFTLRGFIIGLFIAAAVLAPAAGLILDDDSAYATQPAALLDADEALSVPVVAEPAAPARVTLRDQSPLSAAPATAVPETAGGAEAMRRRSYTVPMRVTAYCPCGKCCGKFSDGKTASGKTIWDNDGKFVAAPRWLPFGAKVKVPGFHDAQPVPVYDRGRVITGYRLDVFFFDHEQARRWGTQYLDVEITLPE
ncbi:MAG: 3D domain-containing protein [Phycisphaerae bacterium]